MYEAHAKRKAVERVLRVKDAMVSGIWANTNFDAEKQGTESPRDKALEEIEARFSEAIASIRGRGTEGTDEVPDHDPNDPFFSAMKVPQLDAGDKAADIRKEHGDDDEYVPEYDQG